MIGSFLWGMDFVEFVLNRWSKPFRMLVRSNKNFGSEEVGGVIDGAFSVNHVNSM